MVTISLFFCCVSELRPWLHHSPAPEAGGEQTKSLPSSLLHSQVAAGSSHNFTRVHLFHCNFNY